METALIQPLSLDDIIFEGRNQAYGAYALRKAYPDHVKKATIYMFACVGVLLASVYVGLELKPDQLPTRSSTRVIDLIDVVLPPSKDKVVEKPIIKLPKTTVATTPTRRVVTNQIVPDNTRVKEEPISPTVLDGAEPGLTDALGSPGTEGITGTDNLGDASGSATEGSDTQIRDFVEQMPEFPGGLEQMYSFIRKNLRYPAEATRLGLEGTVIVTFVVNKTGEISDIQVIKEVGGGTAEEAIRVVKKMKPWKPGVQNGQPVPVRFTLPLRFSLGS